MHNPPNARRPLLNRYPVHGLSVILGNSWTTLDRRKESEESEGGTSQTGLRWPWCYMTRRYRCSTRKDTFDTDHYPYDLSVWHDLFVE